MRLTRFGATWQGWPMRFAARVVLALMSTLIVGVGGAMAQSVPSSGTLQMPSGPSRDQPIKPPAAAPRDPVHKTGGANAPKTPVVPPHGPIHPHRPVTGGSAAAKVVPAPSATPAPVAPVQPPSETKAALPEQLPDPEKPEGAPAKLPRFASLRSDDVNMRAGPGTRYRIDWVYKRRDLPVEIEREFDVWRWVRDADGIQGWVHQATLMGRRNFVVQAADATLRSEANDSSAAVAILKTGVIGRIRSCEAASDWCNVQAGSYRGYLHRKQFWGVFPGEAISP
jgi:SH3-like domain-containing protein